MTALEAGRLDEAITRYNTLLGLDLPLAVASTACQNRGNAYRQKGDDEKALRDYEQAIRFNPANAGAYVNRALIYALRKDHQAAIQDYTQALRFDPKLYQAFFNRGLSYRDEGNLDLAERDLTETIRVNQKFAPAYLNRGLIHLKNRKLEKAMSDFGAAIRIEPAFSEAYLGRGEVHMQKRSYSRAAADFEKAARLKSRMAPVPLNSLAWLRATCPQKSERNGKAAVDLALKACEQSYWQEWGFIDTLAAAYAENKEFDKAVKFQEYALSLCQPADENRKEAEERLALYKQNKPYRETPKESRTAEP